MTTSVRPEPVNGNQNFENVSTLTDSIPTASIANGIIQDLVSDMINCQFAWFDPSPQSNQRVMSVTGNSSTTFIGSGGSQFLNSDPGRPNADSVEGGVLVIPPSSLIVGAYAIDATLAGPVAVRIGTNTITGNPATSSRNIFTTVPASINVGTRVTAEPSLATAGFGTAGVAPKTTTIFVPIAGTTGVSVTVLGGAVTASSGLKVTIFYIPNYPDPNTTF